MSNKENDLIMESEEILLHADDFLRPFSKRLKKARTEKNISQAQLASAIGLSRAAIYAYETTSKSPSIDTAARIANYLQVSLDWLCDTDASKAKTKASTQGDIIRILCELIDTGHFFVERESNSEELCNENETYRGVYGDFACLRTCKDIEEPWEPGTYDAFLLDYKKMKHLEKAGAISSDIFDLWLSSFIARNDKIPISTTSRVPIERGDTNAET